MVNIVLPEGEVTLVEQSEQVWSEYRCQTLLTFHRLPPCKKEVAPNEFGDGSQLSKNDHIQNTLSFKLEAETHPNLGGGGILE